MTDTAERPGILEQYTAATGTSDLTSRGGMVPDGRSTAATDMLAASARSKGPGALFMRLVQEWHRQGKPRHPTAEDIERRAEAIREQDAKDDAQRTGKKRPPRASATARARSDVVMGHAYALRAIARSLPSSGAALAALQGHASAIGIDHSYAGLALYRYLHPWCEVCGGTDDRVWLGSRAVGRACHACEGTREAKLGAEYALVEWAKRALGGFKPQLQRERTWFRRQVRDLMDELTTKGY